jgi:MFS family permease
LPLAAYWHLLRDNRNVRLLWMAQVVSELGDWFYSVAIFSFLLELTGSARLVSLAFLMQVLPQVLMSPTAGVINDRVSRRKVMLFADWSRAAIVLSMLLVQSRGRLWLLFVLLCLETVCWALFEPASRSVIPNIAKPEQIASANALSSATWSVNFAVGAALGGVTAVAFGRNTVFVLNALSFVASALLIRRMRFDEPHAANRPRLSVRDLLDFSPIAEGVRYVRRDPKLLATMFVKAGIGMMGANWVILPVLGERAFPVRLAGLTEAQAGTLGMSLLLGSRGAGAIFGAVLGGNFAGGNQTRLRRTILAAFLMAALGYMVLSGAGALLLAVAALILAHCGGSAAWTASTTLLQELTDDRFRGRVFSAEFALSMLMLAICSFSAGQLADLGVDVRTLAFATGALMLVPAAVWMASARVWRSKSQPINSSRPSTS